MCHALGEIDDAEQAFLNALALDGKDSARFALGTLLESRGAWTMRLMWIRAEDTASNSEPKVEIGGNFGDQRARSTPESLSIGHGSHLF